MIGQAASQRSHRVRGARLGALALALGSGWALVGLAAIPAAALDTSWQGVCTFKVAPQAYNEMMRERVCLDQNYCQRMADAQGSPFTGNGCIMVAPSVTANAAPSPRSSYAKR